jgi:predicted secreted protein
MSSGCVLIIKYHYQPFSRNLIMKIKQLPGLIFIIAFTGFISSCKKSQVNANSNLVQINASANGKTTTISENQTLTITLGDPGDGGYTFDPLQYDQSVLKLVTHRLNPPPANSPTGDFGTDTWSFNALKSGSTTVVITATQGNNTNSTIALFSGTIAVK